MTPRTVEIIDGRPVARDMPAAEAAAFEATRAPDMEQLRQAARQAVAAAFDARCKFIVGTVPEFEMKSWSRKAEAARSWLAISEGARPAPPAIIAREASVTGKTPLQVASRIVANADLREAIVGDLTGHRRNAFDVIAAAATPETAAAAVQTFVAAAAAVGS